MSKNGWPAAMCSWIEGLVGNAVDTLLAAIEAQKATPPAPPPQDEGPLWFTMDEASERLGLGRSKVYDLIRSGHLTSITAGTRRLVSRASVENFRGTGQPPA